MLAAVVVLPLVVLLGIRSTWAAYACRVDRQVRTACCCPKAPPGKKHQRAATDGAPRLKSGSCCQITIERSAPIPEARTESSQPDVGTPSLAPVAAIAVAGPPKIVSRGSVALARPPPPAVPSYLVHCSILR